MRNYKRDLLTILLAAYGVGFIAETAYGGVAFIGDANKVGFGAAKKIIPTVFDCPNGQDWYNGKCVAKCDRTTYSQAVALDETKGTIASCTDAWGTYYTYTSCHNGWDLIDGDCKETDCTGFPYTTTPEAIAGTVTSCKSGLNAFYKYLSCNEGWDFSNGKCTVHTCSSTTYPYNSKPSSDAGTVITCKTGVATQYGYSECRTGWDKSNGYCNIHLCDANAFPFTSQPSNSIGTVVSCKTGNDVKYGYSSCTPEYELKNGQCEIKCSLTATTIPENCETATDFCSKNGTTYYATTCASCSSGYKLSNGSCIVNPCTGYGATSSTLEGCKTKASGTCKSGTITKYKCTACYTGYTLNSGACDKSCEWTQTNLPANCTEANTCVLGSSSGNKTYYSPSCTTCQYDYNLLGGECFHFCYTPSQCRQYSIFYYADQPIGIVTRTTDTEVKILGRQDINSSGEEVGATKTTMYWSNNIIDLSLHNYVVSNGYDDQNGEGNTSIIIAEDNGSIAAKATRLYAPSVCLSGSLCGVGKWYLPAQDELHSYYLQRYTINRITNRYTSIRSFNDAGDDWYWSSTEYDKTGAHVVNFNNGYMRYSVKNTTKRSVRPVLKLEKCPMSPSCNNGDFYYTDGTCSSSYNSNKTLVGIHICSVIFDYVYHNSISWNNASTYCRSRVKGNKVGRLPTVPEIFLLATYMNTLSTSISQLPDSMNENNLKNYWRTVGWNYWTSESATSNTAYFYQSYGNKRAEGIKGSLGYARCVFDI